MISCLGITLAVIFIRYPFSGGTERDTLPWYDAILAVLSLGACGYLAYFYGDIELNPFCSAPDDVQSGNYTAPISLGSTAAYNRMEPYLGLLRFRDLCLRRHLVPGLRGLEQEPIRLIAS